MSQREILFKAKRIDNGEWVEGFAGCKGPETDLEKWYIMQSTFCANPGIGYPFYFTDIEVDPETVCQYTGLTDKNGKKIFEGDIIAYEYKVGSKDIRHEYEVAWENGGFQIFNFDNGFSENEVSVIGNIHGN